MIHRALHFYWEAQLPRQSLPGLVDIDIGAAGRDVEPEFRRASKRRATRDRNVHGIPLDFIPYLFTFCVLEAPRARFIFGFILLAPNVLANFYNISKAVRFASEWCSSSEL